LLEDRACLVLKQALFSPVGYWWLLVGAARGFRGFCESINLEKVVNLTNGFESGSYASRLKTITGLSNAK
jgi:hypothetical protein